MSENIYRAFVYLILCILFLGIIGMLCFMICYIIVSSLFLNYCRPKIKEKTIKPKTDKPPEYEIVIQDPPDYSPPEV